MLGDHLAVRLAAERPLAHHAEGQPDLGTRALGVMNAATAEPALSQHSGSVLRPEQVFEGNADIVVPDVIVVRRVAHDLNPTGAPPHHEHANGEPDDDDESPSTGACGPPLALDLH